MCFLYLTAPGGPVFAAEAGTRLLVKNRLPGFSIIETIVK